MQASRHQAGFSLIELLIVLSVLAILAAIVLPRFSVADDQSKANTAAHIVRVAQAKIAEYHAQHGEYPATVDPDWFVSGSVPANPFYPPHEGAALNIISIPGQYYLMYKVENVGGSLPSRFIYNTATGVFHLRVPDQGSDAANLALYNYINQTNATSLAQTTR